MHRLTYNPVSNNYFVFATRPDTDLQRIAHEHGIKNTISSNGDIINFYYKNNGPKTAQQQRFN